MTPEEVLASARADSTWVPDILQQQALEWVDEAGLVRKEKEAA
jgi:hypothetical protein